MGVAAAAVAIALLVVGSRLCHMDLLWIEEAYPMAAAAEVLRGKALYRDIWFDKPPLYALFYTISGALPGWPLRLASAAYILVGCWLTWRLYPHAERRGEALAAALLLAVYLTFYIPSSVMALAPDLLSVPLHLTAVFLAIRGNAFASGLAGGVALLFNTKAVFLVAASFVWAPRARLLAGVLLPNLVAVAALAHTGALGAYWEQVWLWGMRYSADTFVPNPLKEALLRTSNWAGFHAALVIGTVVYFVRERSWRVAAWIVLCGVAVCAGWRFFPRYYFVLLPPMLYAGVRGLFRLPYRWRVAALCTVLIPVIRFGPRYVSLAAGNRDWTDLAMMQDSRQAAAIAAQAAHAGDRLLVWGYRPDAFLFSGLPAATRFLDSQPLTGVMADRHLTTATPTARDFAEKNAAEVANSRRAEIIVDGLGPLNPALAAARFAFLHIEDYVVVGKTRMSVVYITKR